MKVHRAPEDRRKSWVLKDRRLSSADSWPWAWGKDELFLAPRMTFLEGESSRPQSTVDSFSLPPGWAFVRYVCSRSVFARAPRREWAWSMLACISLRSEVPPNSYVDIFVCLFVF